MNRATLGRALGLAAVVLVGLFAASLPRPPEAAGPEFSEPIRVDDAVSARSSLWYCGWVNSGARRNSWLAVATIPDVDAAFTLPDPRVGESPAAATLTVSGKGAVAQDVAEIATRGDAPSIVEFSDGPATVSAVVAGATEETALSGDRCIGSTPKLWHIAGLTTRAGYDLTLRLFNPFPDDVKVRVQASSELGSESLPDLQSIDVIGQSWHDVDVAELLPLLDNLALTVDAGEQTIIPTVIQSRPADEASWPATGLSKEWMFPVTNLAGLTPRLSVWNPNETAVAVEIDLFTRNGGFTSGLGGTIEPGRPAEFRIADEADGPVAVRVRADEAVAAVVVAEDTLPESPGGDAAESQEPSTRIAGTVGAPQESVRWLLAGAGAPVGGDTSIWILNTSPDAVTVTLQPLGATSFAAEKSRIEAGSFRRIRVTPTPGLGGYLIESVVPVTAAWSLQSTTGVAMIAGVAIGE